MQLHFSDAWDKAIVSGRVQELYSSKFCLQDLRGCTWNGQEGFSLAGFLAGVESEVSSILPCSRCPRDTFAKQQESLGWPILCR